MRDVEPCNSGLLDRPHPGNLFVIRKALQAVVRASWYFPILMMIRDHSTNNFHPDALQMQKGFFQAD